MTSENAALSSDPDIVRALARDLDTGFIQLFETYQHVVFSTALRLCARWADAEDITAESFLRAYRALSGYRPDQVAALRPKSWLLTIALNLWRNQQRDAARRPMCDQWEQALDPPDARPGVAETVGLRETERELATLLAVLPPDQRAAVVLRHVVELPVAEIASVLGRPAGTVKSDISRGLRRLRELHPACLTPVPAEVLQ
ncbi:MAG TPA: RNA polymerase sigma factor [Pseudonocardiaceae bacterium]|nr:RNA polymerase sigma factor [Pseudonocardiaceae bacterium]